MNRWEYQHESDIKVSESDFVLRLFREKIRIVLSVWHDGAWRFEYEWIFKDRWDSVTTVRDLNTWPIWRDIFLKVGFTALIRWLLPRTIIDYNRSMDGRAYQYYQSKSEKCEPALVDPKVDKYYQLFHQSITDELLRAKQGFQKPLLLDIHGFSQQPDYAPPEGYDIILWTGNRRSIMPWSTIDRKLADFLYKSWYRVFLPEALPIRSGSDDIFDAGHITRYHSKHSEVSAIQIEISRKFRDPTHPEPTRKLVADISNFLDKEFS